MSSTALEDKEFGEIKIRRVARAKYVRLRMSPNGQLVATMPRLAPLLVLKQLLERSRPALRKAREDTKVNGPPLYENGMNIGSSHHIMLQNGSKHAAVRRGQTIMWTVPTGSDPRSEISQDTVRAAVRKALDAEAKAFLPRRLAYIADQGGFRYSKVRYSNAKGRWGSCNSRGVISLNVALMNLPKELIDYVLTHELSHTRHLNHSAAFWETVAQFYPDYQNARKALKNYSPYI